MTHLDPRRNSCKSPKFAWDRTRKWRFCIVKSAFTFGRFRQIYAQQHPLNQFIATVEEALEEIRRAARSCLVGADRENEGDLCRQRRRKSRPRPSTAKSQKWLYALLVCLALSERCEELSLPLTCPRWPVEYGTAFCESTVDARRGTTAGISASDPGATTIFDHWRSTRPADLARPAVFPLRAPEMAACWCAPGRRRRRWTGPHRPGMSSTG